MPTVKVMLTKKVYLRHRLSQRNTAKALVPVHRNSRAVGSNNDFMLSLHKACCVTLCKTWKMLDCTVSVFLT